MFGGYRVEIRMRPGFLGGTADCKETTVTLPSGIADWHEGDRINVSGVIETTIMGSLNLSQCQYTKN
jgi:hypothetical protein